MDKLDSQSGKKIANAIETAILNAAKNLVDQMPRDKQRDGRITAINNGVLTVQIDNAIYSNVVVLRSAGELRIGDVVKCIIPNNQTSQMYALGVADGTLNAGNEYVLPQMTETTLGGGRALERTTETSPVVIDPSTGLLYAGLPDNIVTTDTEQIITGNKTFTNLYITGEFGDGVNLFTLPSSAGTLALLSDIPSLANYVTLNTTQTITGEKTFSALTKITNGLNFEIDSSAILTPASAYSRIKYIGDEISYTAGVGNSIASIAAVRNKFYIYDLTNTAVKLTVDTNGLTLYGTLSNGTYTYTLPSATGTLALTSQIPSLTNYVTLNTTQTITGAKTFTASTKITNGLNFEVDNSVNTSSYSRMRYTGDGISYTTGIGNSLATITELRNSYYVYDLTNTKSKLIINSTLTNLLDNNVEIEKDLILNQKLFVGTMQTIYNAEAEDGFTGSLFFGNGGGNLSHTTGSDGYYNTGIGYDSLISNTTGFDNTGIGSISLRKNTTGFGNTGIGRTSLYSNTTGYYNTGIGYNSLYFNTIGYGNTSIGYRAGSSIADGVTANTITNNSIYIGSGTKSLADNQTNQIVIGYDTTGHGSNTATIGNGDITDNYFNGNLHLTGNIQNATNTFTLPSSTGTLALLTDIPSLSGYVTLTGTETLTNKTLTDPIIARIKNGSYYLSIPTLTANDTIAKASDIPSPYTLPTASTTVLGGVKVDGTTITINDGVISGASGGGNVSGTGLTSGYLIQGAGSSTISVTTIATSNVATLSGTQTFTGVNTFNAPSNIAGTEQITAKFKTSNGGSISLGKEGPNSGTMLRLDQVDGTPRLRFRSSATAGAMVWSQLEANAALYMDLADSAGVTKRITFNALQLSHPVKLYAPTVQTTTLTNGTYNYTLPASAGTLALTSDVDTKATKLSIGQWMVPYRDIEGTGEPNSSRFASMTSPLQQAILIRDAEGKATFVGGTSANQGIVKSQLDSAVANMVTTNTTQTIAGSKTFSDDLKLSKKLYVGTQQTIYNADAEGGFTGSLFFGNGGGNLSHTAGYDGYYNTANGFNALLSNTTGNRNAANGANALGNNTTGNLNTANGFNALGYNTTGSNNVADGADAGAVIANGLTINAITNKSVYIGDYTKSLADNQTNQIVIGYNTTGHGTNTVTIGNTSITDNYFNGNVKSNGTNLAKVDASNITASSWVSALLTNATGYGAKLGTQTKTTLGSSSNTTYQSSLDIGPFIIKIGAVTPGLSSASRTLTFSTAFPNACLGVVLGRMTTNANLETYAVCVKNGTITTNGFAYYNQTQTERAMSFIAIGY